MPRRKIAFAPGHYYHLYNRGNNHQNIFFERDNYLFFLRQLRRYLVEDTLHVIAYCLMPNHYHLLVYLREVILTQINQ
ncbi:MAG: transposase, partial [Cyanobacteria bacterium J06635_15]